MSDERDPFRPDPEREQRRLERERRRAEREAKRKGEGTRRSLGERVGGALGGGRSSADPDPESEAGAPALESQRPSAPEPELEPVAAAPEPEPEPEPEPGPEPAADSREFFAQPRRSPLPDRAGGSSDGPPSGSQLMRRRLLAAGAVVAVLAVIVLVARAGDGGEEAAAPVAAEESVPTRSLTIPEGLTLSQIGELAKEANLKGSYEKAAGKPPKGFDLKRYGAGDAPSLEGFLFPATYELERRAPASDLVKKQLEAFEQNLAEVNLKQAKEKNLTTYDVVKIASMIEREISVPEERRLAAAVIYNRLADGEPLGIDATLRYELDDFDSPLLESELETDSPYNTRINAGLPPTPIGNPGLASLEAAANPANKDFRFYVIEPGTCNEHVFTADEQEFLNAQAEYQAALEAEGGSPTDCG